MPENTSITGTILIADGKIQRLEIKHPTRELQEIEQLITARNILQAHLEEYEKNNERRK